MNILFIIFLTLLSQSAISGSISFVGPCDTTPLFVEKFDSIEGKNVGEFTVSTLEINQIPFSGSEMGMNSIFNTPTGRDAMEIIGESEFLAYGWCYKINDFEPGHYPHEIPVSDEDHIVWWFGYAHYKDGQWISQCEPSYLRRSPQFCSN